MSKRKTQIVAIAIVFAMIAPVVVTAGAMLGSTGGSGPKAQRAPVEAFLNALADRDWTAAHAELTESSQESLTPSQIANWRTETIPSGINSFDFDVDEAEQQVVTVRVNADDGSRVDISLAVVRSAETFKIEFDLQAD